MESAKETSIQYVRRGQLVRADADTASTAAPKRPSVCIALSDGQSAFLGPSQHPDGARDVRTENLCLTFLPRHVFVNQLLEGGVPCPDETSPLSDQVGVPLVDRTHLLHRADELPGHHVTAGRQLAKCLRVTNIPSSRRQMRHIVRQEAILDDDVPARANQSTKPCNGLPIVPQHRPDAQQEGYIVLRFLPEQIPNVPLLEATSMGDASLRR